MKRKPRARAKGPTWEEYSPASAPHVRGRFTAETFDEDGVREEQRVEARCGICETPFRRTCSSGLVREHIDRFAKVHTHDGKGASPRRARPSRAVQSPVQTESEKSAILALQPLFLHGTRQFKHLARVDAPDIGAEMLTPQRCREMLAIIVKELAPIYGVSEERLAWLAGKRLSLVTVDKRWVPVADYLEGKW
jgi:hypothetical protein